MAVVAVALAMMLFSAEGARDERVQQGVDLYDRAEFGAARDLLVIAVGAPTLGKQDRTEARSFLAAAYHALGDLASARAQLSMLVRESPEAALDSTFFAPELLALADEARRQVADELRPAQPIRPVRLGDLSDPPLATVGHEPRPSLTQALIPFGVGQFSQGEEVKGTLFLGAQVLALATSGVALAIFESEKTSGGFMQGGTFDDPRRARSLQTVHLVAGYTALALMAAGVVDALVTRSEHRSWSAGSPEGGRGLRFEF